MLSKISALALIASVQAAVTAVPAGCTAGAQTKCTDFPTYKTVIPTSTVTADAAGALTLSPTPYACVRNNMAYTWPVTRGAGGIAAIPGAAPADTIRQFYSTNLGTFATTSATAATDNSGCCASAEASCLVGADTSGTPTAPYTGVIVTRVTKAATGTDSGFTYSALHNDFLLAATYQLSTATLGTAQTAIAGWCDPQLLTLTATTNQDLVSGVGMDGKKKCTYIIQAPATTGAPAFVVKGVSAPAAFTFDLHFAEWKTADIATMPVSGATGSNFFGNYAAATYPDPIPAATPAWNSNFANWTPATPLPGSIGSVMYWSQLPGDINVGRQLTADSGSLFAQYNTLNNSYAGYNNALASSNSAVGAYNTAITAEKARVGDFFKAIFEAPVKIPARPCPPSQPGMWNGPRIWYNLTGLTGTPGADQTNEQNARAGAVANQASGQKKTNSGFLQVSSDSTVFNATTLATTGHVFGLAGQGAATMPGTNNAYWSDTAIALANRVSGMMVSVFPNDGTQGALIAGQNITITVKSVAWNDGSFPLNAPAQPAAPAMPEAAMGAKFIAAGLTAATAVAMTLF